MTTSPLPYPSNLPLPTPHLPSLRIVAVLACCLASALLGPPIPAEGMTEGVDAPGRAVSKKPTAVHPDKTTHDLGPRWVGVLRPAIAEDVNPDPDVVEVTLVAREAQVRIRPGGPAIDLWTFNGLYPGPMIDAVLGDRLVVHFYNELPEATSIHWQGVLTPANMDGSELAQVPVEPGGYHRYEFDLDRAAIFAYRTGQRSGRQLEKGLQGALIVRAPWAEDEVLELPTWDHVLVIDDLRVDNQGQAGEIPAADPATRATDLANGLEGNRLVVNGQSEPVGMILEGRPHRLRLVNASNGRFARIGIDGHPFWRLGGDAGLLPSPLELPAVSTDPLSGESTGGIVLAPGERADVVFVPQAPVLSLRWHDVARGRQVPGTSSTDGQFDMVTAADDGRRPSRLLATLRILGHKDAALFGSGLFGSGLFGSGLFGSGLFESPILESALYYGPGIWPHLDETWEPRDGLRPLAPLEPSDAEPIVVDLGTSGPDTAGNLLFHAQTRDGEALPFDQVTADDAPTAELGQARRVEVINRTASDDSFHLQGFRFRLVETEWVDLDDPDANRVEPAGHLEEKDTIRIPRRPGAEGRSYTVTRLLVDLDDAGRGNGATAFGGQPGLLSESGGWLFGSAIPEHAENGMASYLQVVAPDPGS